MNTDTQFGVSAQSTSQSRFLSAVWTWFGIGIAMAAVGAWAGQPILNAVGSFYIPYGAFIGMMFLQFVWNWPEDKKFGTPLYLLFTFLSGVVLYPTLVFASATGQMEAVFQALVASAGLFFVAAVWGYTTKKDLSGMGQFLFFTMIGLFIAGLLNAFVFKSDMGSMIISGIAVVLFSAYTAYDLQAIKNGMFRTPISAAINLYINMFALFSHLLNLFLSQD